MTPIVLDGLLTLGDRARWALMSPDGLYRYALGATWDEPSDFIQRPIFAITMKNPSKATHEVDDTTWLKVVYFAKQEGCGGVLVRNLAAWRATDPKELGVVSDPIGPRNFEVLRMDPFFALRVAAWGAFENQTIRRRLGNSIPSARANCTHVLGLTKDGHPKHPCRLAHATRAVTWAAARTATGTATKGSP